MTINAVKDDGSRTIEQLYQEAARDKPTLEQIALTCEYTAVPYALKPDNGIRSELCDMLHKLAADLRSIAKRNDRALP